MNVNLIRETETHYDKLQIVEAMSIPHGRRVTPPINRSLRPCGTSGDTLWVPRRVGNNVEGATENDGRLLVIRAFEYNEKFELLDAIPIKSSGSN